MTMKDLLDTDIYCPVDEKRKTLREALSDFYQCSDKEKIRPQVERVLITLHNQKFEDEDMKKNIRLILLNIQDNYDAEAELDENGRYPKHNARKKQIIDS